MSLEFVLQCTMKISIENFTLDSILNWESYISNNATIKSMNLRNVSLCALSSSAAKFDSGAGWPSFTEAHGTWEQDESHANILRRPDNSMGSTTTEVICKQVKCPHIS